MTTQIIGLHYGPENKIKLVELVKNNQFGAALDMANRMYASCFRMYKNECTSFDFDELIRHHPEHRDEINKLREAEEKLKDETEELKIRLKANMFGLENLQEYLKDQINAQEGK